ncbi:MAG: RING-HC finger protein [Chlamydiota bacterium]|nr:RING-HC finger protein [Chlamydiota bacterium]
MQNDIRYSISPDPILFSDHYENLHFSYKISLEDKIKACWESFGKEVDSEFTIEAYFQIPEKRCRTFLRDWNPSIKQLYQTSSKLGKIDSVFRAVFGKVNVPTENLAQVLYTPFMTLLKHDALYCNSLIVALCEKGSIYEKGLQQYFCGEPSLERALEEWLSLEKTTLRDFVALMIKSTSGELQDPGSIHSYLTKRNIIEVQLTTFINEALKPRVKEDYLKGNLSNIPDRSLKRPFTMLNLNARKVFDAEIIKPIGYTAFFQTLFNLFPDRKVFGAIDGVKIKSYKDLMNTMVLGGDEISRNRFVSGTAIRDENIINSREIYLTLLYLDKKEVLKSFIGKFKNANSENIPENCFVDCSGNPVVVPTECVVELVAEQTLQGSKEREKVKVEDLDRFRVSLECVICLDAIRDTFFGPCGHIATCQQCAAKLDDCCICKKKIIQKFKVYFS